MTAPPLNFLQRDVNWLQVVESLLFATPEPLSADRISSITEGRLKPSHVRRMVEILRKYYEQTNRAFTVCEVAGGYQIVTRKEFHPWLSKLLRTRRGVRLSNAALETLAIIAYKQPVLRSEIDAIRGVQSGPIVRNLMELGLVRIVGRADTMGKPLLYGTTGKFLETFGLRSIDELPAIEEVS